MKRKMHIRSTARIEMQEVAAILHGYPQQLRHVVSQLIGCLVAKLLLTRSD